MRNFKNIFLGLVLWLGLSLPLMAEKLVWISEEGSGRNEYVYFRKDIYIEDSTFSQAYLNLYADSRYALYINGQYINFGPVRSYHEHPYYDHYQIGQYLKAGDNQIAVKVLSNGVSTYQLYDYHGAFSAWGEVRSEKENINLHIDQDWYCRKSTAYDPKSPRFSFATGPIEVYDANKDFEWGTGQPFPEGWQKPQEIIASEKWGPMQARSIPFLTQEKVSVLPSSVKAFSINNKENIAHFRLSLPDRNGQEYNAQVDGLAYTYIFSPQDQEVEFGLWWGEYFLNGEKVSKEPGYEKDHYRNKYIFPLSQGWNLIACKYGIIWGGWDFYMAFPNDKGLIISANKKKEAYCSFYSYAPLEQNLQQQLKQISLVADEQFMTKVDGWQLQISSIHNANPAKDMVWYEADFEQAIPMEAEHWDIPQSTSGVTVIGALEEMQLGKIFIEGDFPKGTVIDIGFSEEQQPDGMPWLYKRFEVNAGHRFIADGKTKRFETFKPYGLKYLKLNIRNHSSNVKIKDLGVIRQVYPFETKGQFSCSDPRLNAIWEAGWRTLQLCAEDSYTDTPFRERGLYAGDMLPETAITMAVNGDMRLAQHSLKIFQDMYAPQILEGKSDRFADFPLITLLNADLVMRYSRDWTDLKLYFKNYSKLVDHYLSDRLENGLVNSPSVFIEWTDINKKQAAMAAMQGLLCKSMEILSDWALRLDDKAASGRYLKERKHLIKNTRKHLWDSKRSLFYDGWSQDAPINAHHISSSIWLSLYDVATKSQQKKIIEQVKRELDDIGDVHRKRKITPYSSFYLFSLLYQEDQVEEAEAFLKKYWEPMVEGNSHPTVWENFDLGDHQGTASHAWSGHPTYFLSTEVLGVNLGCHKEFDPECIEIMPQSATLDWARGIVTHPLGEVYIDWKIQGQKLILRYSVPKGIKTIIQPKGRLAKYKLVLIEASNESIVL
ncbi:trehalase family glycosidase [Persicobacter diffluens]|uniref:Alpha-L-rhamnosidase six-hairpin glycosidase domain-containing protein n=1 Tax=Persicobacter diffluens TaxID=981 RepID=A0AAN5APZ9_9BACT|nr:hypothetical protein PEDI_49150 [Persicobacter diffluens]